MAKGRGGFTPGNRGGVGGTGKGIPGAASNVRSGLAKAFGPKVSAATKSRGGGAAGGGGGRGG